VEARGLYGAPPLTVVVGAQAHVSLFKALALLGLGRERVRVVPADAQGRMRADALPALEGPAIVCLQAGNVNTGAFDPAPQVCRWAHAAGAWVHVDGAFGLWAAAAPARAHLAEGLAEADSWATDAHKWLNVPYDSGVALVRDEAALRGAMGVSAAYLPASGQREPSDYTPELSRRARGFAAWAVIKALGREGIAQMVRNHCAFARRVAERVSKEPDIHVLNEVCLNQVILAFGEGGVEAQNAATRAVIERLQQDNIVFAGGSAWRDRWVMRLSIVSGPLTEADIERLGDAIIAAWRAVRPS
jgi:glutamate/tyrosine decarboxylase-like PLP-dependent enzyme